MLAPTSPLIVFLLLLGAAGLLVGLVRWRLLWVKSIAGLAALTLSVVTGVVVVNDYFGYYTSWPDAYAGTLGAATTTPALDTPASRVTAQQGRLLSVDLAGAASHIRRPGYVYLPPQYDQPRYKAVRFPVVELLHGTPGGPWNWRDQLHIATTIDTLLSRRAIGPMVFVMPQVSVGRAQECLDQGAVLDDTYVSKDVPADISRKFRVSRDKAQWALMGYSSGGYCAANLALRHRSDFGAAASMDGYYWPADGPAGKILRGQPAALIANDPLSIAGGLPAGSSPMPQFWLSAGSGSAGDIAGARAFAAALGRLEQVTVVVQPGARHNFYSWNDETPVALAWLWNAIAPPALRVGFPTAGAPRTVVVPADPKASLRSHHVHRGQRPAPPTVSTAPKAPRPG